MDAFSQLTVMGSMGAPSGRAGSAASPVAERMGQSMCTAGA
ncbi:MAG: hypothetical protein QM767_19595 [Anaeromyxobacter sp.]